MGGKVQPNSGATLFKKGDVITEDWLIECKVKTQKSDSFSIKKSWLEKNAHEALFLGKPYNAVAFSFAPDEKSYYIIDEGTFKTIVETLSKNPAK